VKDTNSLGVVGDGGVRSRLQSDEEKREERDRSGEETGRNVL
jgi:hypothetical protein